MKKYTVVIPTTDYLVGISDIVIEDPLVYADKNGFRSWSEVKSHVVKTINTFKNR